MPPVASQQPILNAVPAMAARSGIGYNSVRSCVPAPCASGPEESTPRRANPAVAKPATIAFHSLPMDLPGQLNRLFQRRGTAAGRVRR